MKMKTHCLQLEAALALEIDIDLERSAVETRSLAKPGRKDFVFAAGELFVRHKDHRRLVSGQFNTGNVTGFLERMVRGLQAAAPLPARFAPFSKQGPCQWVVGYWAKIDSETVSPEDEVLYDLLSPYCVVAEGNGCIAIYKGTEGTILQVCAQESTLSVPLCYETRVDPALTAARIEQMRAQIGTDVSALLDAH